MTFVKDISEFDIINRLEKVLINNLSMTLPKDIKMSIGDDSAVITTDNGLQVISTDALVENVHFIYAQIPMADLGWKSIAVNYSDIAAMGCEPVASVVTLGLKPDQKIEDIEDLYLGFSKIINEYGGSLIGGDIVKSDTFFISITVIGKTNTGNTLTRANAIPGDVIAVTGHLGNSSAGYKLINGNNAKNDINLEFIKAHNQPIPRIIEGITALECGITTGMDISDGLIKDLTKICVASDVAAEIYVDDIPVSNNLKTLFPDTWLDLVLGGGEDYELLLIGNRNLIQNINKREGIDLSIIGSIHEGNSKVSVYNQKKEILDINLTGWDHFKN
jgi:thiamine-monophosphate kinase